MDFNTCRCFFQRFDSGARDRASNASLFVELLGSQPIDRSYLSAWTDQFYMPGERRGPGSPVLVSLANSRRMGRAQARSYCCCQSKVFPLPAGAWC